MDKTGNRVSSRLDYFIVDQEAATRTTKSAIEPITHPYDHSEITITVDLHTTCSEPKSLVLAKKFLSRVLSKLQINPFQGQKA